MGRHDAIHKQKKVKAPSSQIKSDLQHAAVKSTPENAVSPVADVTVAFAVLRAAAFLPPVPCAAPGSALAPVLGRKGVL